MSFYKLWKKINEVIERPIKETEIEGVNFQFRIRDAAKDLSTRQCLELALYFVEDCLSFIKIYDKHTEECLNLIYRYFEENIDINDIKYRNDLRKFSLSCMRMTPDPKRAIGELGWMIYWNGFNDNGSLLIHLHDVAFWASISFSTEGLVLQKQNEYINVALSFAHKRSPDAPKSYYDKIQNIGQDKENFRVVFDVLEEYFEDEYKDLFIRENGKIRFNFPNYGNFIPSFGSIEELYDWIKSDDRSAQVIRDYILRLYKRLK